jgi:hypothetical protein
MKMLLLHQSQHYANVHHNFIPNSIDYIKYHIVLAYKTIVSLKIMSAAVNRECLS